MNCNLIAFGGKRLGRDPLFSLEKQHNFIYKLMNESPLDGLIILSGPQVNYIGINRFYRLLQQYINIPIVSIGIDISKALNLLIDGKTGIRNLITHLIQDHGYKKIGFLKGGLNQSGSKWTFSNIFNCS